MTDQWTESHPHDLRVRLPVLEFHVAFGCNLTCESCAHYLQYEALDPEATPPEVASFLAREDEAVCRMCPAQPPQFDKPNPLTKARAG